MTNYNSEEQLNAMGITGNTMRLSVGIEEVEDILEDLDNSPNKLR